MEPDQRPFTYAEWDINDPVGEQAAAAIGAAGDMPAVSFGFGGPSRRPRWAWAGRAWAWCREQVFALWWRLRGGGW